MGLILGWGSLQLCQSLVNELYFSNVIQYLISVSKIVSLLTGSLIKNGLSLDKRKSVESKVSVFLDCKYAVVVECFHPSQ